MIEVISSDQMRELKGNCKHREKELDLIMSYLDSDEEIMSTSMIIEGVSSTGKTHVLKQYLKQLSDLKQARYVEIDCENLISRKAIIQKILKCLVRALDMDQNKLQDIIYSCENLQPFIEVLKQIVQFSESKDNSGLKLDKPIVFVLDKMDKVLSIESPVELCAGLTKVHEQSQLLTKFSFVFVVNRSDVLNLPTFAIPTVEFKPYTVSQVEDILINYMMDEDWLLSLNADSMKIEVSDLKIFIKQYIELILNTYSSYLGSDIGLCLPVLNKIWPLFYNPVVEYGRIEPNVNDVLTTFMKNKRLLQSEYGLVDDLTSSTMDGFDNEIDGLITNANNTPEVDDHQRQQQPVRKKGNYDLANKTKYILIASYLASYSHPMRDLMLFSKEREVRSNRKVRYSPRKKARVSKNSLSNRMLSPQPFVLERLLAILRSIWTDVQEEETPLFNDIELMTELATLSSLKSIEKLKMGDTIGGTTKWKCNVNWDVIRKFSEDVGFEIEGYLED